LCAVRRSVSVLKVNVLQVYALFTYNISHHKYHTCTLGASGQFCFSISHQNFRPPASKFQGLNLRHVCVSNRQLCHTPCMVQPFDIQKIRHDSKIISHQYCNTCTCTCTCTSPVAVLTHLHAVTLMVTLHCCDRSGCRRCQASGLYW
jgi:hypothetical protein